MSEVEDSVGSMCLLASFTPVQDHGAGPSGNYAKAHVEQRSDW